MPQLSSMARVPDGTEYSQPSNDGSGAPATKAEVMPGEGGGFSVNCFYPDQPQPVAKNAASVEELAAVLGESFGVAPQSPAGPTVDVQSEM